MMKRKEFMLGAVAGLFFAAAATAGGVIDWPTAEAGPVAGVSGRVNASAGANGFAFAPPQGAPLSFADIFAQVSPAVVQIEVETRREAGPQDSLIQIPGLPFAIPNPNQGQQDEDGGVRGRGAGSGFFISADGFIVTNNHVVEDATEITVKLADGREIKATVVGRDEETDLAVIKVDGSDYPFVSFEESAQPRVGDWVVAVGNPFGLGGTATAGIVSALGRGSLDSRTPYTDYIQIDAAINTGNSGGPTFDIYGRVIGVNSAIISPGMNGGSVGIGFAIPASVAKPTTDRLMRGETIARGYLGATLQTLGRAEWRALGLPDDFKGAYVAEVTPGAPAAEAGLRQGDYMVSVNGKVVDGSTEATREVARARPGDNIRLEIIRDGRRQTLNVRSGTRPTPAELAALNSGTGSATAPGQPPAAAGQVVEGLTLSAITPALRQRYEIPDTVSGVVITEVARGSAAAGERLQAGLVITRVDNKVVSTPAEAEAAIEAVRASGRPGVLLFIRTPQGGVPIVLPLSND
ncbi:trypsin-like peptidase domain-containing protein [Brevundimonas sp.]